MYNGYNTYNAYSQGSTTGEIWPLIIAVIVLIVVQFAMAKMFERIAYDKGYTADETHAFAKCFWLGLYGMIYVAALPNKKMARELAKSVRIAEEARSKQNDLQEKLNDTNQEMTNIKALLVVCKNDNE